MDCPLRQVYEHGAATYNAPINYAIHSVINLGKQCPFLVLLQSTVQ
ncbi:hypothetical protein NC652_020919 [Populus alba x Populus x berolinensis]|nr:hypothetical protein NC652_020919 [Populus alba x Populus x berolinensis]